MKSLEDFKRYEVKAVTEKQFGFLLGTVLLVSSAFLFYKNGNISLSFIFMTLIVFGLSFFKPVCVQTCL